VKILIKLGGTLLEDQTSRDSIAKQLAEVSRTHELVVVHGGGKQVTKFLEERNVPSRFVSGLRVSDESVIDAVTKVIAGGVNKQLVSAMTSSGISAVGLSGVDGLLTPATQLDPDLGFVGNPCKTDRRLLDLLIQAGYVPVVACIAGDRHGNIYNVNADRMAVSCATGWRADKLLFLTDVPGVKGSDGLVIGHLSVSESKELIQTGVAHGGMQAKLESAQSALEGGLNEVTIALGREPDVCLRLLTGEPLGTRLSTGTVARV
jgi:acetylglutamate kinase